jgi:hypothetical protein
VRDLLLTVLAMAGALALFGQLFRALARLGIASVEKTAASGLAEVAARRGDLTSLAERRELEGQARYGRARAGLLVAAWLLLLIVPVITGWTREAYAAASLLWFLPRRRLGRARTAGVRS